MNNVISFGTDGWRAIIGDGFTFDNVKRVAQAACDMARAESKSKRIAVGYDHRFLSERFAETVARVAAGNGFDVELSAGAISSPTLSHRVHERKAAFGFMITASHNPPTFNGFKIKGQHGGSVPETITKKVMELLDVNPPQWHDGPIATADFVPGYLAHLKSRLQRLNFGSLPGPVIFDAMHGPGGAILERLYGKQEKLEFIRAGRDPLFGGVNPEPIEVNLQPLREAVLRRKAAAGLAVDGDADRIGVIDDKGRYLPPHTVMPLLILHLLENRKLKGKIVQTVSMGYLPERIAREFKAGFDEVSVGFKYIAEKMASEKVLVGGEESGGYGVGLWSPERDGILCAILILEMISMTKKRLSDIVDAMMKRFGASHFERVDFHLSEPVDKAAWTERISSKLDGKIAGHAIKTANTSDGIKITVEDGSWVLMRPSGTEPLIRTYSEAASPDTVKTLLKAAEELVRTPPPAPPKVGKVKKKK
jgi:phosphomannomutase